MTVKPNPKATEIDISIPVGTYSDFSFSPLISPKRKIDLLGHKNVETTQIYADMSDDAKRLSVERITLKPKAHPLSLVKLTGTEQNHLCSLQVVQGVSEKGTPCVLPS